MTTKQQPFTVFVEGNIGSGKTTFIQRFQNDSNYWVVPEPIDRWQNFKGQYNLLDLMYNDPERWAMPFQMYVLLTMWERHLATTANNVKILERSLLSVRHCFVEHLYRSGHLNQTMYSILLDWHDHIEQTTPIRADLIVYLRTTPDIAYQRIQRRAREEEKTTVTYDYVDQLHQLHEAMLLDDSRVLVVDANKDLDAMDVDYQRVKNTIELLS